MDDAARTTNPRALIVDDEPQILMIMRFALETAGFDIVEANDGAKAWSAFTSATFDLVLLDLMLPGIDGIEVCRRIRRESDVPIVMLTARTDTADVVAGLEAGADDYVPKPFKPKELVARIRARLRGREDIEDERLVLADLVVDVPGHVVHRGEETIPLTPLEFDLLVALGRAPWKVFSREELLEKVWGYRHAADTRLVNDHVQRLRAKVEKDPENPEAVLTVRGVGYKAGPP